MRIIPPKNSAIQINVTAQDDTIIIQFDRLLQEVPLDPDTAADLWRALGNQLEEVLRRRGHIQ